VVLIGRSAVHGLVLGCVLLAGCSESLFGARGGGGGGGDGGGDDGGSDIVPGTCTGSCIADAAANFDGTPAGKGGHWRYLEDHRVPPAWTPMRPDAKGMIGNDPGNHITTCTARPDAPACSKLPKALLVSSAGTASDADSAIEFTASGDQVIKLNLRALVPSGDDQTIRVYRNSREDVLFTGIATAGIILDHEITLDALTSDRFLVAVAPTGTNGVTDVGLHLTISTVGVTFPSACQLALRFENITGSSTADLSCRHGVFTHVGSAGTPVSLVTGGGPFIQQGNGVKVPGGTYLHDFLPTDLIDHSQGVTVQFWFRMTGFVGSSPAFPFSDMDLDAGGGIAISLVPATQPTIEVQTCTSSIGPTFASAVAPYTDDGMWQFMRVVHSATEIRVCLNGKYLTKVAAATTKAANSYPPDLGKDVFVGPAQAFFDGSLDDVRVITGALPCDPP
jgi:hypothetical protein